MGKRKHLGVRNAGEERGEGLTDRRSTIGWFNLGGLRAPELKKISCKNQIKGGEKENGVSGTSLPITALMTVLKGSPEGKKDVES